ncbi:hypothetical protein A2348_03305 [Candidatus Uhrbacteria bacterium RIFOXYB12_FULL_58_10]|uniref:Uncharacterized protein n=1 Tax=Candidatus Uhrbacteria bacterium RIFOXYB2_FULL_57_15 TaxID=1802422 RepID=A0A1F7W7C9_9BACT|nr:MAG: hypothetical protein A2348_03305 [Candidatus Uhrbacteria bacterium RIFOXYB12_FULL_58_10]OGL98097.1 MAG: hypothetical protein A2304_03360 [Candidatus Uhrbacteria bacterium RIFOXYB2_FULL_57_15]
MGVDQGLEARKQATIKTFEQLFGMALSSSMVGGDVLEQTIDRVAEGVSSHEPGVTQEAVKRELLAVLSEDSPFAKSVRERTESLYERLFSAAASAVREAEGDPVLVSSLDAEEARINEILEGDHVPSVWLKEKLGAWKARERARMVSSQALWKEMGHLIPDNGALALRKCLADRDMIRMLKNIRVNSEALARSVDGGSVLKEAMTIWGELVSQHVWDTLVSKLDAADSMGRNGEMAKLQREIAKIKQEFKERPEAEREVLKKDYDARVGALSTQLRQLKKKMASVGTLFGIDDGRLKELIVGSLILTDGDAAATKIADKFFEEMSVREVQHIAGRKDTISSRETVEAARRLIRGWGRMPLDGSKPVYFRERSRSRRTGMDLVNQEKTRVNPKRELKFW